MKALFERIVVVAFAVATVACSKDNVVSEPPVEELQKSEYFSFRADVSDQQSKVDFDYTTIGGETGMFTRWDGTEEMDVFIHRHADRKYEFAGRIPALSGTLSSDRFSLSFAGDVRRRESEEDEFVMVYTNSGAQYDWTKQTLDMRAEKDGIDGSKALKNYAPIVFEKAGDIYVARNKACFIRLAFSGLTAGVKVKSLSVCSADNEFPKAFDLTEFAYQAQNKSKTLSYAFENLSVDENGSVLVYLAAPIIAPRSEAKTYDIYLVTESSDGAITTNKTTGVSSLTAFSESKLYKLTRTSFSGAKNPAAAVGGAGNENVESIVGQWDKTGYLSNDIYGVLDKGKPENLTMSHNAAINAIHKIYNQYFSGNYDQRIHGAAVLAAGKQGQGELAHTNESMTHNGPQYVTSEMVSNQVDTLTFNNIHLLKDTEVYMTFIDSKAWNTNTIGYYCCTGETDANGNSYNTLAGHASVPEFIVFPSTSQDDQHPNLHHKFEDKTTAQLLYPSSTGTFVKTFPQGTVLGLFGRVNALDETSDFALKQVSSSCPVHYTNIAWNRLNTWANFSSVSIYWNQIACLKFRMPGETGFNRHGLIYAMKDNYAVHTGSAAANWTNPIILIYTSEADAIDFSGRGESYWQQVVDMTDNTFAIEYDLDGVTSTNTATVFNGSYTTTLTVANPEFGGMHTVQITTGGVDITDKVYTSGTGVVNIPGTMLGGDILIRAHAGKRVYVKSLTAAQLQQEANSIMDNPSPEFRIILHCLSSRGDVAFGFNGSNSSCLSGAPFAGKTYSSEEIVNVFDEYNAYEWTLEYAQGGFRLKKLDFELSTLGYLQKSSAVISVYPLAKLEPKNEQMIFEAVSVDDSQFKMKLRLKGEQSMPYLTCAIGQSLESSIFNADGAHVTNYGIWRAYKVSLADR